MSSSMMKKIIHGSVAETQSLIKMTLSLSPSIHFSTSSSSSSSSHFSFSTKKNFSVRFQIQPNRKTGVIVIGAGLAGLAAATKLTSENIPFLLLESSDGVGGRVRTDKVDGFLLDRGFQIFITAYPEAQKLLDYQALDLQKFYSGARIYFDGQFHTVADPLRHFSDAVQSLANPIGSILDKLLIALTRIQVLTKSDDEILSDNEVSTIDLLRSIGFSDSIIRRFFTPFFGGIFFDRELETTSRLFNFIFKCLALGENTLPANGIGAIPNQLAAKLPENSILLNTRVASIDYESLSNATPSVRLETGEIIQSEIGLILAVEEPEADKLLAGKNIKQVQRKQARSTVCVYFSSDPSQIPVKDPALFLNGSGKGIVNNMFFATNVAMTYGPSGKALISVSLIGCYDDVSDDDLTAEIVKEMCDWFDGSMVLTWKHLRTYRIRFAQPNQSPPSDMMKKSKVGSNLYLCGDYMTSATFDGALVSGRRAVEVLVRDRISSKI